MSNGNPPLFEERLRTWVQVEQPHGICNRGSAFANAFGDLVLGQAEIAMEPLVCACLLDRIEIFALEVLDKSEFKHLAIACRAYDRWGLGELEFARGPPAAFPGDQFVLIVHLANDERLD